MKNGEFRLTKEERRVQEAVRTLGGVPSGIAFRDRLKQDFISGAIAEQRVPSRERRLFWRPAWQAALLFAVVLLAITVVIEMRGKPWKLYEVQGIGQISVNGQEVDSQNIGRLAKLIDPRARIHVLGGDDLDLIAGDALLLELAPGSDVTIPKDLSRWFPKPLDSFVHSGEVRLRTGPGFAGRAITISSAEGRTKVTGTAVSIYKGDDFTCVCVLEGSASIGKDEALMEEVSAGLRKVMFRGDQPSMVSEIQSQHKKDLINFLERTEGAFE